MDDLFIRKEQKHLAVLEKRLNAVTNGAAAEAGEASALAWVLGALEEAEALVRINRVERELKKFGTRLTEVERLLEDED